MDVGISSIRLSEPHGVVCTRLEEVVDSAFVLYALDSQLVVALDSQPVVVDVLASEKTPMSMASSTNWALPS